MQACASCSAVKAPKAGAVGVGELVDSGDGETVDVLEEVGSGFG